MKLLRIIPNADMRCRQEGLLLQAKKAGVKNLKAGDLIAFINRRADRIIVIGMTDEKDSYGVLSYYRSPRGRIEPQSIQYIPSVFGAGRLDMDKATELALIEMIGGARTRK